MGAPSHDKAISAIMKWAQREEWRDRFVAVTADHLEPVCEEFDIAPDELPEILGPGAFAQLIGCALEDFLTCDFEPDDRNIVDDYLKRRGWKEPVAVKRYLQALRNSVMSLYEVIGSVPGSHFVVKDLVRGGEPIRVDDKLGSQDVVQWDRLAARLLPIGDKTYMAGGVLRMSFEDADLILEEIAAEKKNLTRSIKQRAKRAGIAQNAVRDLPVDEAVLGELATIFTRVWLASGLQQILGATAPELVNADGEDLVFFQMRFPISDPNQSREIESRLDRVADLVREGADEPTWTWLSTTAPSGEMPAGARRSVALKTYDEQGRRVLGSVVLEPVAVVLNANSQERAERGREMLAKALEPLVGRPSTVAQTPEQVMAERPVDETGEETPELPLLPEEVTAAIHEVLDRHYREILSQPNPMFDGKSPKQAIRSKAGRQKVAEWLKQLENSAARLAKSKGIEPYDHTWIWKELEVSDLRQ